MSPLPARPLWTSFARPLWSRRFPENLHHSLEHHFGLLALPTLDERSPAEVRALENCELIEES